MKKIFILLTPLLIFAILFVPYSILNSEVIVEKFGCGCPQVDEYGNIYESRFDANDFTACLWGVVAIMATFVSGFISTKVIKNKLWLKLLYVLCVSAASLCISYLLCRSMMWK